MSGTYYVRLLGPVAIEGAHDSRSAPASRKSQALLGYLARQSTSIGRSQLADLFWGEASAHRARRNLTRELSQLTTQLPDCFEADYHGIQWVPGQCVWLDTAAFEMLLARGGTPLASRPEDGKLSATSAPSNTWIAYSHVEGRYASDLAEAINLYHGDFMAGLNLDGCAEFETWLIQERELWRRQATAVLEMLITYHAQYHEDVEALMYARRWLALEPWQEDAHRYVMVLLARNGKRSLALAQYEMCRRILALDLAVEPTDETMTLCEQIRAGVFESEVVRNKKDTRGGLSSNTLSL